MSPCPPVSLSWLSRSSSYTRRLHSQSGNDLTSSTPSLLYRSVTHLLLAHVCFLQCLLVVVVFFCSVATQRTPSAANTKLCLCEDALVFSNPLCLSSSSYGKRLDDTAVTSASTGTSSAGLSRPNSVLTQRCVISTLLFSPAASLTFSVRS